ncbi:MAG: DUF3084 domain-containing protein [Cyanobacteria bacterium J06632_3]
MTGFVLLFAVACLGGVIATVGDRIGMKVGKSRLSLFNLRPRQTATVVSVATGMVASFSTLMLMIALDSQLRKGLFDLDEIQQDLSQAQADLEETRSEKDTVENNLEESLQLQEEAQLRLRETNRSLRTAVAREEETLASLVETQNQLGLVSEQADSLRGEINGLRSERQALIEEQANVRSQIAQRDAEIAQRNEQISERDAELRARNAELSDRNQEIAQRDAEIAEREARLETLQTQQAFLSDEISRLEDEFQGLRLGNVAIGRNETLAVIVARSNTPEAAQRAVEAALVRANSVALRAIWPGLNEINDFAIRFDPATVNQIVQNTTDERNYAIRVFSAANYIVGEPCVGEILNQGGEACLLVNIEAPVNEIRFAQGDTLASVRIDSSDLSNETLLERYNALQVRSELQARREGIIYYTPIITRGLSGPVLDFLGRVQRYGEPLEIQTVASQPIYTIGPVYLGLAATQNGRVLFSTLNDATPPATSPPSPPSSAPAPARP